MMKKKWSLFFCLFLLMGITAFGQTRKQLENQRKKLKSEIRKVNTLLFETQKTAKNALEDLKDLNQKITVRTKFIEVINLEANLLLKEIQVAEKKLEKLDQKLKALKADYAAMIFKSYKSKSQQSRMLFVLSSQNFYQAYKRFQYMKQYTSFRKKQGEEIVMQTKIVQKLNDSLTYQKQQKDTLIEVEKIAKENIETDKKTQESLIAKIKKDERKYKTALQKKQKEEREIALKIEKLIKEAIARANKKKGTKKSKGFILSPEAKALAAKFSANKGKLPWPVKKGLITRKFGKQRHPTISGITVNSTGLHIATEKGSNAECIFNGKILAVQLASEGKKSVLVQHGNYISAYNNLATVFVKTGDEVTTGQSLGQIFTDKITGKTTLVFVLFQNTKRLNPSLWILKP